MAVYLIHFEEKYHHAQHYIGYCESAINIEQRFKNHKNGNGAKLLRQLNKKDINYHVVRIWPFAERKFERYLKSYKKARLFCPICNPNKYHRYPKNSKQLMDK